jgi:hypothetical protein
VSHELLAALDLAEDEDARFYAHEADRLISLAQAEERLGRPLSEGELQLDPVTIDRVLAAAKADLVVAITREQIRALKAVMTRRTLILNIKFTPEMQAILVNLYLAGQELATLELDRAGVELRPPVPLVAFAERDYAESPSRWFRRRPPLPGPDDSPTQRKALIRVLIHWLEQKPPGLDPELLRPYERIVGGTAWRKALETAVLRAPATVVEPVFAWFERMPPIPGPGLLAGIPAPERVRRLQPLADWLAQKPPGAPSEGYRWVERLLAGRPPGAGSEPGHEWWARKPPLPAIGDSERVLRRKRKVLGEWLKQKPAVVPTHAVATFERMAAGRGIAAQPVPSRLPPVPTVPPALARRGAETVSAWWARQPPLPDPDQTITQRSAALRALDAWMQDRPPDLDPVELNRAERLLGQARMRAGAAAWTAPRAESGRAWWSRMPNDRAAWDEWLKQKPPEVQLNPSWLQRARPPSVVAPGAGWPGRPEDPAEWLARRPTVRIGRVHDEWLAQIPRDAPSAAWEGVPGDWQGWMERRRRDPLATPPDAGAADLPAWLRSPRVVPPIGATPPGGGAVDPLGELNQEARLWRIAMPEKTGPEREAWMRRKPPAARVPRGWRTARGQEAFLIRLGGGPVESGAVARIPPRPGETPHAWWRRMPTRAGPAREQWLGQIPRGFPVEQWRSVPEPIRRLAFPTGALPAGDIQRAREWWGQMPSASRGPLEFENWLARKPVEVPLDPDYLRRAGEAERMDLRRALGPTEPHSAWWRRMPEAHPGQPEWEDWLKQKPPRIPGFDEASVRQRAWTPEGRELLRARGAPGTRPGPRDIPIHRLPQLTGVQRQRARDWLAMMPDNPGPEREAWMREKPSGVPLPEGWERAHGPGQVNLLRAGGQLPPPTETARGWWRRMPSDDPGHPSWEAWLREKPDDAAIDEDFVRRMPTASRLRLRTALGGEPGPEFPRRVESPAQWWNRMPDAAPGHPDFEAWLRQKPSGVPLDEPGLRRAAFQPEERNRIRQLLGGPVSEILEPVAPAPRPAPGREWTARTWWGRMPTADPGQPEFENWLRQKPRDLPLNEAALRSLDDVDRLRLRQLLGPTIPGLPRPTPDEIAAAAARIVPVRPPPGAIGRATPRLVPASERTWWARMPSAEPGQPEWEDWFRQKPPDLHVDEDFIRRAPPGVRLRMRELLGTAPPTAGDIGAATRRALEPHFPGGVVPSDVLRKGREWMARRPNVLGPSAPYEAWLRQMPKGVSGIYWGDARSLLTRPAGAPPLPMRGLNAFVGSALQQRTSAAARAARGLPPIIPGQALPRLGRISGGAPMPEELKGLADLVKDRLGGLQLKQTQNLQGLVMKPARLKALDLHAWGVVREVGIDELKIPGAQALAADVVNQVMDKGIARVYEDHADLFDCWQYTAIMDARTCDVCAIHDGRRFRTLAEAEQLLPNFGPNPNCLGGGRCRCRLVPCTFELAPGEQPVIPGMPPPPGELPQLPERPRVPGAPRPPRVVPPSVRGQVRPRAPAPRGLAMTPSEKVLNEFKDGEVDMTGKSRIGHSINWVGKSEGHGMNVIVKPVSGLYGSQLYDTIPYQSDNQNERAAWLLAKWFNQSGKDLGLEVRTPPVVIREVIDKDGLPSASSLGEMLQGQEAADVYDFRDWIDAQPDEDIRAVGLFDNLILNHDRHQGNFWQTPDEKLWLIDHSLAFPDELAGTPGGNNVLMDLVSDKFGDDLSPNELTLLGRLVEHKADITADFQSSGLTDGQIGAFWERVEWMRSQRNRAPKNYF